jgi:ribosomal protein S18 acetylase RimI-like enzyme
VPTIAIHPALTPADVDHVRTLMRTYGAYLAANPAGAASICLEGLETELAGLPSGYEALLLATVDQNPAGCVAIKLVKKPNERACEMKRLWVAGPCRGLKLGRQLVEAAIAWSRTAGFHAMYLDTVPAAMPQANALYERLGFERVDRYNDNPVPDLAFFRLPLE